MTQYFDKTAFLNAPDLYGKLECEHPVKVYNKYLGKSMYVGCRKCRACGMKRASRISKLVEQEVKNNKYSIFFTLTYRNDNIPKWSVSPLNLSEYEEPCISVVSQFDGKFLDVPASWYVPEIRYKHNGVMCHVSNVFASVSVRDVQLFIKRLRSNLHYIFKNTNVNDKIRYFVAAEYGPKSFRPHYHGIIFTNEKEVADLLTTNRSSKQGGKLVSDNLLYQSWKKCDFARIKPSLCTDGKAARYVSDYICGVAKLPPILQTKFTRPFYLCSRKPFIGFNKEMEKEVFGRFMSGVVAVPQRDERTNEKCYFPLPLSFLVHFFPLPSGNGSTNDCTKLALYEKYQQGRYSKQSAWNYINEKGTLIDNSPLGRHHETDAYNYQDKRFADAVKYWCSTSHEYYEFDVYGYRTGRLLSAHLTPQRYILLQTVVYGALVNFNNVRGFAIQAQLTAPPYPLVTSEFVNLCNKYGIACYNAQHYFFYSKDLALLPPSVDSREQLLQMLPWFESLGEYAFFDFYYDLPLNLPYNVHQFVLREDFWRYVVWDNPYIKKQSDNLEVAYFKKYIYKNHLSNFNENF